jgi:hypothetical protein
MLLVFAERQVQPAPFLMAMLALEIYKTDILELLCSSSMTFSVVVFAGLHRLPYSSLNLPGNRCLPDY